MAIDRALVEDRKRLEKFKASFNDLFSYHEGETDQDYIKAKQGIIDHLNEWERKLIKKEQEQEQEQ